MPFVALALGAGALAYSASQKPKAPKERNIAAETAETLETQIRLAPDIYESEKKFSPLYTDLEVSNSRRALLGEKGTGGYLDLIEEISPRSDALTAAQTSRQREADITDVERYGSRATQAFLNADPEQARLRKTLNAQIFEELRAGDQLTPYETRQIEQSVRGSQAARGFGYGNTDAINEAVALYLGGQALKDRRRAAALGMMGMNQATGADPFMQVLSRPAVNPGQNAALGQVAQNLNANAGPSQMFDPMNPYAADLYNTNYNAKAAAGIARGNQAAGLASGIMGATGSIAGGYLAGGYWDGKYF